MKKYFIFYIYCKDNDISGYGNAILRYTKIEEEEDIKNIENMILNMGNYKDVILQSFIVLD